MAVKEKAFARFGQRHTQIKIASLGNDAGIIGAALLWKDDISSTPISIIITTLAASAYNNETDLYSTLSNILQNMPKFIKKDGNKYIIENPVMNSENSADKWNENPKKAEEFFIWLKSAQKDIIDTPINEQGLHKVFERLEYSFGRNVVQKSIVDDGNDIRNARESNKLYVGGLTGGIHTTPTQTSKKVGGHTFFGK